MQLRTPEQLVFGIDGYPTFSHTKGAGPWPFDRAFHLILNVAIGGTWGGKQGVDAAALPAKMEVDYVRVYQTKPVPRESYLRPH